MKKRMRHLLAVALSVVTLAGTVGVLPAEAVASNGIVRVGNKNRTTYVGKEIELKVNEGWKVKEKHMKWSVGNSSILAFEDGDRYGDDMEFRAKKAGTTTVKCKNLLTGKYVSYKVTVKKASNTISRVGNQNRTYTKGKEFELKVTKKGTFSDSKLKWTIGNTSVVKFADDDRYGDDMEFRAVGAGTTTVSCNNLLTGGKISFKVTVKAPASNYYIKRVGNATKTVEVDDDLELRVSKGTALNANQIKWSIDNTSILRFEDGDNYGAEVEVEGRRIGTTKVRATNLKTGAQAVYTIKVVRDND